MRISQTRCGIEALWRPNSDFALLFVAGQFALDGDVSPLRERAGEVSQLPESDTSMPLPPRLPPSDVTLP